MAYVYILYSLGLKKYYIGSCLNLDERIAAHRSKKFGDSFTSKASDWALYFFIGDLEYNQARQIEKHIKQMKSRAYIENLIRYKDILIVLIEKYK